MTIPCWIISLDPAAPRAMALSQSLLEQGIPHSYPPAVDGRKGTPALVGDEQLNIRKAMIRHQKPLTNSELGCYLAHYRAVKAAHDQGLERICILEDDVILEPDFANVLQAMENQPAEIEMVRLMALRIRKRKIIATLSDSKHQLVRPERGGVGTQGYILNRQGMKKVISYGCNIFEPIDKIFDHFWEFDLHIYGIEPHVLYEMEHDSSVQKKPVTPISIPIHYRCLAPIFKLLFSLHRHIYLNWHKAWFYPATKPEQPMGKTKRLH